MNRWKQIFVGTASAVLISTSALALPALAQNAPTGETAIEAQGRGGNGPGRGAGREEGNRVIDRSVVKEAVATSLGMTVEELDAAKEAGQTYEEIAEAQGVAYADVVAAAKASMTEQVNAALAAGEITQEQADRMLERIAAKDSLGRDGRGHHRGDRDAEDEGETETESTTGDDDSDDSETPLARGGSALATASTAFVATDFLYLPTLVGGPN